MIPPHKKSEALLAYIFQVTCFAAFYYVVARLSLVLAFEHTNASPVWPPSGIAFAVLLIFGHRLWPGILLGAFCANAVVFAINQPASDLLSILFASLYIAAGNTLEAWAGVRLLRHRLGSHDPLDQPYHIFRFMLVVLGVCMISSTIGPFISALFGFIPWRIYPVVWFTWWIGDVAGILILSTIFLPIYKRHPFELKTARSIELVAFLTLVLIVSYLVFGGIADRSFMYDPLSFVFIPFIVFTVFRYGEYGLGATVLIVLGMAIGGTIKGYGPFVRETLNQSLLYLEGFIGIVTMTGLILAAAVRENRMAESIISDREKWFRTLIENSNDVITLIDPQGKIAYSSPSTTGILGYKIAEYQGRTIFEFIHPDDLAFMKALFEEVLQTPRAVVHASCRYRHKDGGWVWLEGSGINLLEDATVQAIVINCRDITERKGIEQRHQYVLEAALDGFISMDQEGRIIEWNTQAAKIFGWPASEVLGKVLGDIIIPHTFRDAHSQGLKRFLASGVGPVLNRRIEITALHRNGHLFPVELSITPIRYKDQFIFAAFLRDITERKSADEQLRRYAQQLKDSNEDLENFAFVASHDLQEPLRIVSSYIQLFTQRYEETADPNIQKYITYIKDNVSRMQEMITGLLEYSRAGKKEQIYSQVSSAEACDQAKTNLGYMINKKSARITREALPVLLSNETEMIQLFQNLIGNALKYCTTTPEVHIGAADQGENWLFSVKDNGIGMDPKYNNQIFEVFKRLHTKSEYPGTGMGLSICKKIVERHGGRIWVDSKPNNGSTFYFTVPKQK